jgi:drug/metabolite transporter (DMT)-like permease
VIHLKTAANNKTEKTRLKETIEFLKSIGAIIIMIGVLLVVLAFQYLFLESSINRTAFFVLFLGSGILMGGCYNLIYLLPRMKEVETRISMEALRASFWMVIFGLIIILLGLLHMMGILPPLQSSA